MIGSISTSYTKDLLKLLNQQKGDGASKSDSQTASATPATDSSAANQSAATTTPAQPQEAGKLTPEQERMVAQLRRIDTQVRAHEAAHQSVGGSLVGGASFSYQTGPDGKQYAVGGDVPVDMSTSGDQPAAVITKMQQVQAAAMAPADPSGQDYAVAAQAAQVAAQAQILLAEIRSEQSRRSEEQSSQKASSAAQAYARNSLASSSWAVPAFSAVA